MNIAEHRLTIFHQIEELSEESLLELEKIIAKLKANQKTSPKVENDISAAFGLLKAKKSVSLEQMEEAIAKAACGD
jgi:VIT1/CCC1 family predicted Fe2+/Mn2+ transporter